MAKEIIIGLKRFRKYMDKVARKQLPFITKLALNKTAFIAQRIVRKEMPKRFVIRRSWTIRGIVVKQADKRTLTAFVYSRDDFMEKQETGGIHKARKRRLAIPDKIRRSIKSVVPLSKWPRAILPKNKKENPKKIFLMKHSIVQRKGGKAVRRKGRAASFESKFKILYRLRKQVKLKPKFRMRQTVEFAVLRAFPGVFNATFVSVLEKEAKKIQG